MQPYCFWISSEYGLQSVKKSTPILKKEHPERTYAQIMFWNSYFREFPSAEEPWGRAIWGLPAASGWPSFASPKCKVLSNLGRSRESCRYQPCMKLLEGFGVQGLLQRNRSCPSAHTTQLADLSMHDARWAYVRRFCQDILAWPPLLCFGRPAVTFIEAAWVRTEYPENTHYNFLLLICPIMPYIEITLLHPFFDPFLEGQNQYGIFFSLFTWELFILMY